MLYKQEIPVLDVSWWVVVYDSDDGTEVQIVCASSDIEDTEIINRLYPNFDPDSEDWYTIQKFDLKDTVFMGKEEQDGI
jgi:hypothetical protein